MSDAKIEIKVGGLTFSGQGEEKWLSEQLDKLLAKAGDLAATTVSPTEPTQHDLIGKVNTPAQQKTTTTLASYLTSKNATKNQVSRFLATAEWLTQRGKTRLMTADVTKALSDNHQPRLSNPADCLNKNVAKGYCEKNGKEFFVTPDGRTSLG